MERHSQTPQRGRSVTAANAAHANEYFEHFLNASTLKTILGYSRNICDLLHLRPNQFPHFYPKLRANLTSWRAKALWKKFDQRASHKCYGKGKACPNTRVLIIGAGPCGLRSAIEAQLLGAKVVVIEKRDRMSRNNVLHLWPFVIEDLRILGAKKFFGKFCAGAIDHISIRQLQCILLKVALLIGVEIHTEVSFERLVEPNAEKKTGWRAEFKPSNHPVSQYEFDVVIGADGKRNTLQGFKRKEFRGKLAIAITANFINKRTEAEARVEEISGVAFIFNQKFFKDLYADTGIDLENIVYYKDDTHYFVMTAKKASLIDKGVIKQDLADTEQLLSPDNVNREALMNYAREAADFSTNYQMPNLEFAVNHYGQPDVAMFDFTSMYAAENASKVIERNGYRLLMILVGDSLLEPFWPTGSGCARGFLSSLDAGWAIRSWASESATPLEVMAERESIYRLLAQTTPDNLNKEWKAYTLDPATRYPNLNRNVVLPHQVFSLFDSDNPKSLEHMKRASHEIGVEISAPKRRKRDTVDKEDLLKWIREQIREHDDLMVSDVASVFRDGRILCAVIHHYRPDLLDYGSLSADDPVKNNHIAFEILEKEIGLSPVMTAEEMTKTEDFLTMTLYLTEIYHTFRCEIPHINHPKVEIKAPVPHSLPIPLKKNIPLKTVFPTNACQKRSLTNDILVRQMTPKCLLAKTNCAVLSKCLILTPIKSIEEKACVIAELENDSSKAEAEKEEKESETLVLFQGQTIKSSNFDYEDNFDEMAPDFASERTYVSSKVVTKSAPSLKVEMASVPSKFSIMNIEPSHKSLKEIGGESTVEIRLFEVNRGYILKKHCLKFDCFSNTLTIAPKTRSFLTSKHNNRLEGWLSDEHCHAENYFTLADEAQLKFLLFNMNDSAECRREKQVGPEVAFDRVVDWLSSSDFEKCESGSGTGGKNTVIETNIVEGHSDITSVTKCVEEEEKSKIFNTIKVEKCTDLIKINAAGEGVVEADREDKPAKFVNSPAWQIYQERIKAKVPQEFPVIFEGEEAELPEPRRADNAFTKYNFSSMHQKKQTPAPQSSRPSSRHKRHIDTMTPVKPPNVAERKPRKRRTLEKVGASVEERQQRLEEIVANRADRQWKRRQHRKMQTEQFIKSMQMLQANAKTDSSEPFEDYSIFLYRQTAPNFEDRVKDLEKKFTYTPDREGRQAAQARGEKDEDFAARIKDMEDKWREPVPAEKKPKDLLRAIGKIETSDWNIKEIEKKINENKLGKTVNKDKEKVPKWSREQFLARQTKMEKQHLDRQDSKEAKYADIDKNIKQLEQKLKEGTNRDLGQNKVASITERFVTKNVPELESKPIQRSNSKVMLPTQGGSDLCHFCGKRVYLMERLSAEGRFFHHGCFRCQYCHIQLRLGSYSFDKDGHYGHKFFCVHHYGMQGELPLAKVTKKGSHKAYRETRSPEKKVLAGVAGVDLLDRVQTPERIEFSNLSTGNASSDHDEPPSQMDEDEWTDRNFGASTAEIGSSDDEDSSSLSDTDSDEEDAYEEALEEPITKEGTMKWAERLSKRYARKKNDDSDSDDYSSSDQSSYYENTSGDDDSETATEDEEDIRARELRRQEVRVEPPVIHTDTGTDTEIASDESSSESSSEIQNSATEISTDSEFAQDDPTPTREIPSIVFNDFNVTKTRGTQGPPKRIQVTSGFLQGPYNGKPKPAKEDIELKLKPLVPSSLLIKKKATPLLPRNEGYALNRTQSTGGIAAKVSLELKKKYLLGENALGSGIQKSGSASTLDSKLKSFHTNISDCQKLLKPVAGVQSTTPTEQKPDITECTKIVSPIIEVQPVVFENVNEGRPRSPVHETSIIVPEIDWNKAKTDSSYNDSLSSDSDKESDKKSPDVFFENIPRLEIHKAEEDQNEIALDSLTVEQETKKSESIISDIPKSITSEKKELNRPKLLPNLDKIMPFDHSALHKKEVPTTENESGRSTPSHDSVAEQITAALTETELSDWARDGAVSDDCQDEVFELNSEKGHKLEKFTNMDHICGKEKQLKEIQNKILVQEAVNNVLSPNLDNIEFMDTGTETSSDDGYADINNGYVQFKDEEELAEDSLNPNIKEVIETANLNIKDKFQVSNTGYCIVGDEKNNFGAECIDLKPTDIERLKQKHNNLENDEDSLLIVDTGTTTEENTCSDSTVKNVKEKVQEVDQGNEKVQENGNVDMKPTVNEQNNKEFQEHCQRLQSKIEFGNVKDSIDIRKSRRKSKSESPPKPDLIQEEKLSPKEKDVTLQLTPTVRPPHLLYKKEEIERERDMNKKLIQDLVMSKMKAQNKSLERKKRNRNFSPSLSPAGRPFDLSKSATVDLTAQISLNSSRESSNRDSTTSSVYATPDLLSTSKIPLQKSQTVSAVNSSVNSNDSVENYSTPMSPLKENRVVRPLSVYSGYIDQQSNKTNPPDVRKSLFNEFDGFKTPVAPPRTKHEETKRTAEKLKQDARARVRLLSNEELGLSPEDKLLKLKEKLNRNDNIDVHIQDSIESLVMNNEKRISQLYSNDTLSKKRQSSFKRSKSGEEKPEKNKQPTRTKSVSELSHDVKFLTTDSEIENKEKIQLYKSDPNLLTDPKKPKKKSKNPERRKSFTKMFATLFTKKAANGTTSKSFLSRISPKSKDKSKSCINLDIGDAQEDVPTERRKSFSEPIGRYRPTGRNVSPPPVPPLPSNYPESSIRAGDSSDGENGRREKNSSCDTLDQSGVLDGSLSSVASGRKSSRGVRKALRQTQLKRHRMAQEIQRKLEETEVKTKELEERGVLVEKALRGESAGGMPKEDSELLQEWFDLMRDRTELRRYEKELMVRAQELELEDRHARLQQELRERLESNENKTEESLKVESHIINEMMEIVAKRDSLIAVLEEDRIRYSEEDRDFEEKMLSKGLKLTPVKKPQGDK